MSTLPDEAVGRFTAAEAALYPLAMSDTEGYQRATTLVGLVVAELRRTAHDIDTVLESRPTLIAALPGWASEAHLTVGQLSGTTIVDAASALRCRELIGQQADAALRARIEAAREAGQQWFDVEEPEAAANMAGMFRQVELHITTGTVLISAAEMGSDAVRYTLEVMPGEHAEGEPPWRGPLVQNFDDRDSWQAALASRRAEVEAIP